MNKNRVLMIIIALCAFGGNAFSADWKFYGESATPSGEDESMFYDSESLMDSNNSIKLMVKSVVSRDIEKGLENKAILEKAAAKIARGYEAPIAKIFPNVANVSYLEEAANDPGIRSRSEISYQIVCSESKYRRITGTIFRKDGSWEMLLGIGDWENIVPASNAENLAKIVCGMKK